MICGGAALIDTGEPWRQGTKEHGRHRRIRPGSRWHLESKDAPGLARCCDAVHLGHEAHRAVRPDRACRHCLHRVGMWKIGGGA